MARHPDPITRLVRACPPNESLQPDDPRYVECDEVRGTPLVDRFERSLRQADPTKPEFKLFAGHRGVGKTSELLRLKQKLERPAGGDSASGPFHVIYFDITDKLDENDIDFPDLLVLTAAEVQRQLSEAAIPGFNATTEYLTRVWDDIWGLLNARVTMPEAEVGVKFANLALEFRNQPNARDELRKAIERQSTSLLGAVNDLLTVANTTLRQLPGKQRKEGLVLIIDGLDKVVRRDLDNHTNTHDRLFVHRREQLASLRTHVVYNSADFTLLFPAQCPTGADHRRIQHADADDPPTAARRPIGCHARYAGHAQDVGDSGQALRVRRRGYQGRV
jgi:signal transduction histidine kinase